MGLKVQIMLAELDSALSTSYPQAFETPSLPVLSKEGSHLDRNRPGGARAEAGVGWEGGMMAS